MENNQPITYGSFEYSGYHFIPYRQFGSREISRPDPNDSRPWKKDAQYAMRNMRSDFMVTSKNGYSYESFYAASGDSKCDIFRCVENGKLYVPAANELFSYTEPKTRTQKKSVINALDGAKREAAKTATVSPEKKSSVRKQESLE